ncbi:MAG TPA: hypothetical protein VF677_09460 [Flavobacterium sp.]|jgi:hypothetical protein
MKIEHIKNIKSTVPLCFINDTELLVSQNNKLFLYDIEKDKLVYIIDLQSTFLKKAISKIKLLSRLLRLGVRYSIPITKNIILVVFNNRFFELNIIKKEVKETFVLPRGNRPLNITEVKNIKGFDDGLYFGEYFENLKRLPVHIYKRNFDQTWSIVFTFPEKTIEHVHNIIPDPYNDCLWLLVGDFDKAAGIWKVTENFQKVEPIVTNKQKYRACVAYPTEHGLVYATDSQLEKNSIRILKKEDEMWVSRFIKEINGPAIYGCKIKEDIFFSTSVEGDSLSKGKLKMFLDKKPGPGILDNNSVIVGGNLEKGFNVMYKNKKDKWPFILFQFGVMIFPSGKNNSDKLILYNIALKSNDLNTSIFNIKK